MNSKFSFLLTSIILGGIMNLNAQIKDVTLPIKKVTLYSSGVGFFEHQGSVNDDVKITLPFQTKTLNDVLKSLTIYDPKTNSPHVSYPSEETLQKTLDSLSINLSSNPTIIEILNSLRGAEVKIYAPKEIRGKILGTQTSKIDKNGNIYENSTLSLFSDGKIQIFKIDEILSYSFVDKKISDDLNRALELILNSKNSNTKNINVFLPAKGKRDVRLNYVMESPVWKATYRFDLSNEKPFLQGWAIVDNVGDIDWNNIELSLVTGRPTSFIQNLYAPYHVNRPIIPLSIAGFASAKTYDSGFGQSMDYVQTAPTKQMAAEIAYEISERKNVSSSLSNQQNKLAQNYQTTSTKNVGELFIFTAPKAITIERQQSAMIPLIQTTFDAQKVSIFSGIEANRGVEINPALGVRIKNNSGMKLPAGPISIYDAGTYAGDALLEFLPENEKRIISYGDDLSVRGFLSTSTNSTFDSVKIAKGVLEIKRSYIYVKTYTLKNSASFDKKLVLEHPFIFNAKLIEPKKYDEKTANLYRFDINLLANKEINFNVKEEVPNIDKISISSLNKDALLSYSTLQEFPKKIQDIFKKAASLQADIEQANNDSKYLQTTFTSKLNEQDRIRKNIDSVKSDSTQGKEYIKKLNQLDNDIETLNKKLEETLIRLQKAQKAYSDYLYNLDV